MKTPEQMAEEHANLRCPEQGPEFIVWNMCRDDFLAGYKARLNEERFCVHCNDLHRGDCAEGRGKNHPAWRGTQWISVKERLPEISENDYSNRVLLLRADGFIVISRIEKCVRFVRPLQEALIVETENGDPIEEFTHWMPLPEAPKEEK